MDIEHQNAPEKADVQIRVLPWLVGLVIVVVVAIIIIVNLGEAQNILALLRQANPWWIVVGLLLQVGTYVCAAGIWYQICISGKYRPAFSALVRMSIEMLSFNQIVPVVGMAGNVVIIRAMRRMHMPYSFAMDALFVEILSKLSSLAVAGIFSVVLLFVYHDITTLILWLSGIFLVVVIAAALGIFWLMEHRRGKPPKWLGKWKSVAGLLEAVKHISPERVFSLTLLAKTSSLYMCIFLLDAGTLWAMMFALGTSTTPLAAFVAVIIASIVSTVSVLPTGDLGSFEAACAATLSLLGVPVAAAVTGTLLLRALTFWLPLIPGLLIAQREMRAMKRH